MIYNNVLEAVGNTPMIRLNRIQDRSQRAQARCRRNLANEL